MNKCSTNCQTCDYKKFNKDPELYCYMFKDEPQGQCRSHSAYKNRTPIFEQAVMHVMSNYKTYR